MPGRSSSSSSSAAPSRRARVPAVPAEEPGAAAPAAGVSAVGSPDAAPVAKRARNGARAKRFCLTFYGAPDSPDHPRPHHHPGLGRASPPIEDYTEEQEGSSFFGPFSGDAAPVHGGDGRDRPGVPDLQAEAVGLGAELRAVLESDHQVSCFFAILFLYGMC